MAGGLLWAPGGDAEIACASERGFTQPIARVAAATACVCARVAGDVVAAAGAGPDPLGSRARTMQLPRAPWAAGASGAPFAGAVGGTMRTGWGQLRVAEFLAHSRAAGGSCVAVLSAGAVTGRSTPELRQRVGVV